LGFNKRVSRIVYGINITQNIIRSNLGNSQEYMKRIVFLNESLPQKSHLNNIETAFQIRI